MPIRQICFCLILVGAAVQPACADSVENFYRGQTISMVVSSSPGGGYDTLSRAVARFLGEHIPGKPAVVVRNMPGAGGIVATRYIADVAPRDGLTIAGVQNNTPFEPLFGTKEADYDPTKLTWLGTPSVETGLLIVWHTSPIKSLDDARKMQMTAGASGANSAPSFYARLLNELLGLKIKIISGFPGQNEAYLAMERGEIDSYGVTFWSSLTSTKPDWIKDKKIRILVQYGPEKESALPDVPYGPDLVRNAEDRSLFEAAYAPLAAGRPFVAPPGLPDDRAAALRDGLFATFNDPAFLAEARRLRLVINKPTSGESMQSQIAHVYQMPQKVVERLRRIAQTR
ncbi:MAG TPA: tripartite tricarboxylate transporter substrate-binding protein [Xanthobacteraceae bacterium]|jgi:tripartite-type tricarboxylate transporter receptor subunit TctC